MTYAYPAVADLESMRNLITCLCEIENFTIANERQPSSWEGFIL